MSCAFYGWYCVRCFVFCRVVIWFGFIVGSVLDVAMDCFVNSVVGVLLRAHRLLAFSS